MNIKKIRKETKRKTTLSPKQYNDIIEKIELRKFILIKCKANLFQYKNKKDTKPILNIRIENRPVFNSEDYNNFSINDNYKIIAKIKNNRIFEIELEYLLSFSCSKKIDNRFFKKYSKKDLHNISFPYIREMVYTLTSRMGIPPLILPIIKFSKL